MMPTGLKNIVSKPKVIIPTIIVAVGMIVGVVIIAVRSNKPAQAELTQAQANQVKTQLDVNKYAPLAEQKAVTQQDLDNAVQANLVAKAQVEAARAGVETARAQLRAANAQIGTAKAAINTAKGQVENAKAAARTAELNLSFTRIISPIDGIAGIPQAQVGNLIPTTNP